MKIILFGGHGTLGTELRKIDPFLISPTRSCECDSIDITDSLALSKFIEHEKPDIVINAAAVLDNRVLEYEPEQAISTNIVGAANVANACIKAGCRYVYISTDYIYKGDRGNYLESDEILPFNFYAWTKLGGECSAIGVKNHLIIRTSFGKSEFSYPQAFIDKWSSKDYVDHIAPMIYDAAVSPITGVLNLGTDRKTLFSHARERNDHVKPVKLADTNFFTPYDTSLNLQKWINYKSEKSIAKNNTICRVCGSFNLRKYLDLGLMPLANNLEITSLRAKEKERFPLQVMFCEDCGLSQLSVVIDPEKMFSYYTYESAINAGYVKHCYEMCLDLQKRYLKDDGIFHIDIAGNDGTLLLQAIKAYKEWGKDGYEVLNVDPAANLTAIAEQKGIESLTDFWSLEIAKKIVDTHGQANLITATNVFAHVDNVNGFLQAAKFALRVDGILVLEFPYLVDFIEGVEFDTIYFEHLSYFSVLPLNRICSDLGLKITNVERQTIHGGTIRVTITDQNSTIPVEQAVFDYVDGEFRNGYAEFKKYSKWSDAIKNLVETFSSNILKLKKEGYKIAAFAASAKGNTLLNSARINTDLIDFIADETPSKIGKFSPGTGIPIVNKQEILKSNPDYIVILSWNFQKDIIEKLKAMGFKGKFIIPIPEWTVID